jgi:hypothetical protein
MLFQACSKPDERERMNVRWKMFAVVAAGFTLASPCGADTGPGPALRVGFYRGHDFTVGTRTTRLEGIELGGSVPLSRAPGTGEMTEFSASVVLGGSFRRGADADGEIFRFLVTARRRLGASGLYAALGAGYSFSTARQSQFSAASGFAQQYGVGFSPQTASRLQPFAEVSYHNGTQNQLRGWTFGAGARF